MAEAATETLPRQRIQKLLANAGLGSRREVESWLEAGRISVNGRVATPGDQAGEGDRLVLDGKVLQLDAAMMPQRRVLIYHKPVGEMTTRRDPEGRPTIFDKLPTLNRGRWVSVGRLDFNTSGLMILTTDGQLAARLMHPSRRLVREYAVRLRGELSETDIERLSRGVRLEDGPARFEDIHDAGGRGQNHWYHVILREGRYREVRRLFEAVGATVSRLIRVRYGPLELPSDLPRGHWRELKPGPVRSLMDAAELSPEAPLAEAPLKRPPSEPTKAGTRPSDGRQPRGKKPQRKKAIAKKVTRKKTRGRPPTRR